MIDSSLRISSESIYGSTKIVSSQSIRGFNTRSESVDDGKHARVYIHNRDLGYMFLMEPEAGIYTAVRVNRDGQAAWAKPKRAEPVIRSGRTVHNYEETIDTGDRKELFGYPARRVITRSRQVRDSETLSESECDGWYIEPPQAWTNLHPPPKAGSYGYCYISVGNEPRDDYKFHMEGQPENGFMVMSTKIHKASFTNQSGMTGIHESVHRSEVTELSEAPLARDLFVPPPQYRRVLHLSNEAPRWWAFRLRPRWEMLKDSFGLSERMTRFSGA